MIAITWYSRGSQHYQVMNGAVKSHQHFYQTSIWFSCQPKWSLLLGLVGQEKEGLVSNVFQKIASQAHLWQARHPHHHHCACFLQTETQRKGIRKRRSTGGHLWCFGSLPFRFLMLDSDLRNSWKSKSRRRVHLIIWVPCAEELVGQEGGRGD